MHCSLLRAAQDDLGIIYADLDSLISPDKAFPGRQSWAIGKKIILDSTCQKGDAVCWRQISESSWEDGPVQENAL